MRRAITIIPVIFLVVLSCSRRLEEPEIQTERELSVAEKVEKEMMEVLSRDWKTLSDTLSYFDSEMLSKGRLKGIAPDGVYYELDLGRKDGLGVEADFSVEDSTWVSVCGQIVPLGICLSAFDTEFTIRKESGDSTSLSVSEIKVVAPLFFLCEKDLQASLLFEGRYVGFLTWERFENTDYSTGTYVVAHFNNDPRTFAIYDKGLINLLKQNLTDVLK